MTTLCTCSRRGSFTKHNVLRCSCCQTIGNQSPFVNNFYFFNITTFKYIFMFLVNNNWGSFAYHIPPEISATSFVMTLEWFLCVTKESVWETIRSPLQWRHNGAMASQITSLAIVYSIVYSRRRSKKTSKLRVNGFCEGNSLVTGEFPAQVNSPHKGPVTRKMFPFDDVIMTWPHVNGGQHCFCNWTALRKCEALISTPFIDIQSSLCFYDIVNVIPRFRSPCHQLYSQFLYLNQLFSKPTRWLIID